MRRIGLLVAALIMVITWMFYRNDAAEESKASSTPPVTVEVVRLSEGVLNQQVHLLGNVFALRSVEIKPEVDGRISDIAVQSGQQVKQGQLLVQLDNRHQRAVLMREQARLSDIQRQHQNLLQLLPKGATTQAEVDRYESQVAMQQAELALAEAALQDRALRAPFDGQLGLVDLSLGQVVNSDTVLMTLDDASTLRLNVPVAARYLGQIQLGQTAQLRQSGAEQRVFEAKVSSIDSRVRGETLNVFVQLSIDNQQGLLAPGTLMSGELSLASSEHLLMPLQAVAYDGERRYAYRLNQQTVDKVEVLLGQRGDEQVEVLSGLVAGDQVVYKGLVKLHDGIEVEVLN
ncbi:efflux RND transporter periplasmic adaptor subunit [Agarivorans gilvus]|uniref:MexH family multidrug efflux RND transporter periplasmic adaptor subunit n=1 Tax=Agarivorans gilvus TaxID=680279 RepID=A0ABQ1I2B5_9ALTE|nr:efflux RND transporter periplasmic adaptor subunit [Agarivorans gilvus]GGB02099.1 MexH family multidrug efflux RND transporter periplasmic adaptor subunit [Agarivorans gilvus]